MESCNNLGKTFPQVADDPEHHEAEQGGEETPDRDHKTMIETDGKQIGAEKDNTQPFHFFDTGN